MKQTNKQTNKTDGKFGRQKSFRLIFRTFPHSACFRGVSFPSDGYTEQNYVMSLTKDKGHGQQLHLLSAQQLQHIIFLCILDLFMYL